MTLNQPHNPENFDKKSEKSLISDAQIIFTEEKLESDLTFFDGKTSSDIFSSFKSFLNKKEKFKEVGLQVAGYNTDQQDTLFEQINEEKNKILFSRKKILSDLEKVFGKEYDSLDFSKLKNEISSISLLELKKLMKSEAKRRKFLLDKGIFDNEEKLFDSKKLDEKNLLENIGISKKSYKKLPDEAKQELFEIFNNNKKLNFTDLENILNVLEDKKSKENLLKYFVSSISVADLEKAGFMKSEVKKNIISEIKSTLGVSDSEAKDIYNSLDKENIFVSVDDLDSMDFSSLLENKSIQKQILDEYNSELEEIKEGENSFQDSLKMDEKGNIHKSFIDAVKSSPHISLAIKEQIDLLKEGNYFEILSNTKSKVVDADGEKEISDSQRKGFYNIKRLDVGTTTSTKSMIFENITSEKGVKKLGYGIEEIYSYENFLKLLQIASNKESGISINFQTRENFKKSGISEVVEDSSEVNSYEDFVLALDNIDPEGKDFGLDENKTTFIQKDDDGMDFVYIIKNIDKSGKTITLDQGGSFGNIKISFSKFFSLLKKEKGNLKRGQRINTFNELVNSTGALSGLELKNGSIINKEKDPSGKYPITVLSGEKGGKEIHIHEISESGVDYTIGDVKVEDVKGKKGKKVKKFKNSFTGKNLSQLKRDIEKFEFTPVIDDDIKEKNGKEVERHGSLIKKFLSGLSIKEILSSGEFLIDALKKKFERGNRLKSLKFAQKFSWIGGKELKLHIQSSAEQEEKSLVNEMMDHLRSLNSGPMVEQIILILKNKDSEIYEVVAALMAISKYGTIYPKELAPYAGSYLWFKALGGTDSFRKEQEQKAIKEGVNFTEEDLVFAWLNKLGKNGIVRSKLYKDFRKELSNGLDGELEDGEKQCGNKVTIGGRKEYYIDLLEKREYAGAIGSIKSVFGFNGKSVEGQGAAFIFTMSGFGKNFDQEIVRKVKGVAGTTPYGSLIFGYSESGYIKYKKFIEALIMNAPKFEKNKSQVLADFKQIEGSKNTVRSAQKFWDKYGSDLVNYINFKDNFVFINSDKIPEFKAFVDGVNGFWQDGEFEVKSENMEIGIYNKNPISIAGSGNGLSLIRGSATGGFQGDASKNAFKMYIDNFNSIKDSDGTLEQKKNALKKIYEPFERHIADVHGQFIDKLSIIRHPIYAEIKSVGLDIIPTQAKLPDYDYQLDKILNNFLNSTGDSKEITNKTRLSIGNIIAANDENYRVAA